MEKLLIIFLSLLFIDPINAQDRGIAVLEDLEESQDSVQPVEYQATLKSASRLFDDKNNLTSVILIIPSGSVIDVIREEDEHLYVIYEGYEGFIRKNHATVAKKPVVTGPLQKEEDVTGPVQKEENFTGPSESVQRSVPELKRTERHTYLQNKYGADIASRMLAMKIWKGMTGEMVQDSWGNPRKINRIISGNNVQEEWIYNSSWLYIENDILVDWGPTR
jgi:hypothetical protein